MGVLNCSLDRFQYDPAVATYNLGTGRGYSVLEMVKSFEDVNNVSIPYRIVARRPGDVARVYADPNLARKELGWTAQHGIEEMVRDTWHWQSSNPEGYE